MSNSPLVDCTCISPHRSSRNGHKIDTITIHCAAAQAHVETLGRLFQTKEASANYGIGTDGRIGMYVEEKDRSWCSSNPPNDARAITIEVASDNKPPYAVNGKAYASLINLLVDVCKRNGIKKLVWSTDKKARMNHLNGCNMTAHRDYENKACPGDWLYNREGQIANEVNKRLEEDDEMTQAEFNKMADAWLNAKNADEGNAEYATEALEWGKKNGIMLGNNSGNMMANGFLTRQQFIVMLKRFYDKLKLELK